MSLHKTLPKGLGVLVISIALFLGCSKDMRTLVADINNDNQNPINYQPAPNEAQAYAVTLMDMTLKLSANGLTSYEALKQSPANLKLSGVGAGDQIQTVSYRYENGYHIWEGTLDFDRYQDTLEIHMKRVIQFRSHRDGEVLQFASRADYMYLFYRVWGRFGFVNGEKYGEKFDHFIEGEWTGLMDGVPTFNATGKYDDTWSGIHNGKDVVYHYLVSIHIDKLKFRLINPDVGYSLNGRMQFTMTPYFAEAVFNDSPKADVTLYRWGNPIAQFQFPIPNLYGWEITRDFPGLSGSLPYMRNSILTVIQQLP